LETQCRKEGNKIISQTKVFEREVTCISGEAVELKEDVSSAGGGSKSAGSNEAWLYVIGYI